MAKKVNKKAATKISKEENAAKRNEIRMVDIPDGTFSTIKKLAKEEKRTMAKQAEYMIEKFIEKGGK